MRNAAAASIKRTAVKCQVNAQSVLLFILFALSIGSSIGSVIRLWFFADKQWYLFIQESAGSKAGTLTFSLLLFFTTTVSQSRLLSRWEVVKYQQAQVINLDLNMYSAKADMPALCRTSSLVEELGQIEYAFSDETGALTRNELEFRIACIAGVSYTETIDESKVDDAPAFPPPSSSSKLLSVLKLP
ncbi:hypothetical protein M422DRAFT_251084 [Sphaerobolus stellatus SS14]|uniref:Uncharacterized protein n=1 Tax=Sphaerobolus stellatus (strain SS14) TaxID=990650 RepID=A0A0C9W2R1_SPHS4|nr:hypothetical protein M422DRAFT_251084 [Sphaerobolus stellatus SS14]